MKPSKFSISRLLFNKTYAEVKGMTDEELYQHVGYGGGTDANIKMALAEIKRRQSKPHMPTFALVIVTAVVAVATLVVTLLQYRRDIKPHAPLNTSPTQQQIMPLEPASQSQLPKT